MTDQIIIILKSESSADAVAQILRYLLLDGSVEVVIRECNANTKSEGQRVRVASLQSNPLTEIVK